MHKAVNRARSSVHLGAKSLLCVCALVWISLGAHAQSVEHIVQPGDTLLALAVRYNTTVSAIQSANNLANPDHLQVGQRLRIPAPTGAPVPRTHVVQPGDTLLALALRYGVSVEALVRANRLANPDQLNVGQRLVIPADAALPKAEPTAVVLIPLVPVPTPTPAAAQIPARLSSGVSAGDIEGMRQALLLLHNQARAANSVSPLIYSSVLQRAAQAHADDCAARGSCSHIGSDGSRSSQRIARAGYSGRITGENWAWARSVEQAFEMWYYREMPSGPHLNNILSPRYVEVGFGIAAGRGGYYFVVNFGAP
ncbi:MAG: LysM peptidoglycan-binding domain-containing protein [Anaerolineae bacterium]|nr:LysM peptidoglycan-binding domain-containing protein [Thermoflexales bacterium]MDW8395702.1 LysM peptidoglycan-binding domain-containing protein [Anaerolineae bacterium]